MKFLEVENKIGNKYLIELSSILCLGDEQRYALIVGDDTIYHNYKVVFHSNSKDYEIYLSKEEYERITQYIDNVDHL